MAEVANSAIQTFRSVVDKCGLMDLGLWGDHFTWINRHEEGGYHS